jgi:hypothetical protein
MGHKQEGSHALVIGGSMAGLLAARVLSDYFEQVTTIDRDHFPLIPEHRKGVPQSHHAHTLLTTGQRILTHLFPGIMDDLRTGGGLSVSNAVSFVFVTPAGKLPSLKQQGEFLAFNPIYGQGMTVSALDAMTLDTCLREQKSSPRPNFAQYFQQALAKTVANAWFVSSSEDLRWPGVALRGARPAPGLALLHRYMNQVLYSAVEDSRIAHAYLNVITMVKSPNTLSRPEIVVRVFMSMLKRGLRSLFMRPHATITALSPSALRHFRSLPAMSYEEIV